MILEGVGLVVVAEKIAISFGVSGAFKVYGLTCAMDSNDLAHFMTIIKSANGLLAYLPPRGGAAVIVAEGVDSCVMGSKLLPE